MQCSPSCKALVLAHPAAARRKEWPWCHAGACGKLQHNMEAACSLVALQQRQPRQKARVCHTQLSQKQAMLQPLLQLILLLTGYSRAQSGRRLVLAKGTPCQHLCSTSLLNLTVHSLAYLRSGWYWPKAEPCHHGRSTSLARVLTDSLTAYSLAHLGKGLVLLPLSRACQSSGSERTTTGLGPRYHTKTGPYFSIQVT